MSDMITLIIILLNFVSLFMWFANVLMYMPPVMCKDAKDRKKFFSKPLKLRFKIFLRSMKRKRYVADFLIFISSISICAYRLNDMYNQEHPIINGLKIATSIAVAGVFLLEIYIRNKTRKKLQAIIDTKTIDI